MFGIMLFLHLAGLAIWLGSLVAISVMLSIFKKNLDKPGHNAIARSTIRVFNVLTHPSAFIILVTGLVMVLTEDYGDKTPFWLFYMQNIGGLIIIAVIAVLSIFGKKAARSLLSADAAGGGKKSVVGEIAAAGKSLSLMVSLMTVSIVLILSVVLIVSYRFG
ncbi:hypothetical protein [Gorillibacterium massiliense]|uniref:hypothetical protein n=1 Tax=Gorillibacterium massiliense TaxID=1280390 RepID=UPI0004B180DA|nr:hypothetical protein [Gorillibacterium massiliense]